MSSTDHYEKAMSVFDRVCDLSPSERETVLAEVCANDDELRRQVDALLEADAARDDVIDDESGKRLADWAVDLAEEAGAGIETPVEVAGYRIIRKIGEGGMGVIFEAEQVSPRRNVALKLLRSNILDVDVLKRFQNEAQVLGLLQHPGIAHVYESGVVEVNRNKQPFLAMELIHGDRISLHAEKQDLSTRDRVELVARVCDAVHHAHQKSVIHRDLKPANVLVVCHHTATGSRSESTRGFADSIGQPKILDFGIARITDRDVQATSMQTEAGQIIGTLVYMSPEQLAGDPENIDTRSDVYSIGVILYEILTGRLPLDVHGKTLAEAARILRDEEPRSAATVNRTLRGDLDTIVAKAIEKDPNRRYASAAALADDLRRYLGSEPIAAHPPSAFYQVRKFASRHRALVGGALATVLALSAGLIVSSVLLVKMTRERDAKQAALEAKQAALEASQEVTRFFTNMIALATPESLGKDTTVREMVDLAADDIDQEFQSRPLLEARIRRTIGSTYLSLSEYEPAQQQAARALAILETTADADSRDLCSAKLLQAQLHLYRQEYEAAIDGFDVVIAAARKNPDFEVSVGELMSVRALAAMRLNRLTEAEQGLVEAVRLVTETEGENSAASLIVKGNLAELYSRIGSEKAEPLYKTIIEQSKEIRGASHPETLTLIGNLAGHYVRIRRDRDAIKLLREILDAQTHVQGASHRQTLISVNNLAVALINVGRVDEAMPLVEKALATSNEAHGESSATSLFLTNTLAMALRRTDQHDRAEKVWLKSIRLHREMQGPNAEGTYRAEKQLLIHYVRHGHLEQALERAQAILDRLSGILPEDHAWFVEIKYYLALTHFKAERYDQAESRLLEIETIADQIWRPSIRKRLAELCEKTGRPEEASRWRRDP